MENVYGEELRTVLLKERARTLEIISNRWDRINDGSTDMDDCFLSAKLDDDAIRAIDMKLEILNGDGFMEVEALEGDGDIVQPSRIKSKYGYCYAVWDENGTAYFASTVKKLAEKSPFNLITVKRPVWVAFGAGSGGGMCAVYTGHSQMVQSEINMVTGQRFPKIGENSAFGSVV